MNDGTAIRIGIMPKCASVCFDQRAADDQPHADAFLFTGKKWLENICGCFFCKPWAAVLNGNQRHVIFFVFLDFNGDVGSADVGSLNCINSIAQQVQYDFLNLQRAA